jgi:hypothetical protein
LLSFFWFEHGTDCLMFVAGAGARKAKGKQVVSNRRTDETNLLGGWFGTGKVYHRDVLSISAC